MPTLWIKNKSWRGEKEAKKGKTWKPSRKMDKQVEMEEGKKGKMLCKNLCLDITNEYFVEKSESSSKCSFESFIECGGVSGAAFIYIEIDEWMRNDIINKSLRTSTNRFLACPTFATFKHSNSLSHYSWSSFHHFRLLVQRTFTIATHPCASSRKSQRNETKRKFLFLISPLLHHLHRETDFTFVSLLTAKKKKSKNKRGWNHLPDS